MIRTLWNNLFPPKDIRRYYTPDGTSFDTLEEAQAHVRDHPLPDDRPIVDHTLEPYPT